MRREPGDFVLVRIFRLLALLMCLPTLFAAVRPLPEIVAPGVISTGDFESHIEFTPDGHTAYFLRSLPNFAFWTIFESHLGNGQWSRPEIAPFSGHYNDADPFITRDGRFLFFMSNRPLNKADDRPKGDSDISEQR